MEIFVKALFSTNLKILLIGSAVTLTFSTILFLFLEVKRNRRMSCYDKNFEKT